MGLASFLLPRLLPLGGGSYHHNQVVVFFNEPLLTQFLSLPVKTKRYEKIQSVLSWRSIRSLSNRFRERSLLGLGTSLGTSLCLGPCTFGCRALVYYWGPYIGECCCSINTSYSLFSASGEGVPVSPSGREAAAASQNPTPS